MKVVIALGILLGMLCPVSVALASEEEPEGAFSDRLGPGPAGAETDSSWTPAVLVAASDDKKSEERKAGESDEKDEKREEKEEKKRYKKKEEEKRKSGSSGSAFDCITSCLFDAILDGICGAFGDGSEDEGPSLQITHEFEKPLTGAIEPPETWRMDVKAWVSPGGEPVGSRFAYRLTRGTEVLVWRRAVVDQDTAWLQVSRRHTEPDYGWVRARDVIIEDIYEPDMFVADTTPDRTVESQGVEGRRPRRPIGWLKADLNWFGFPGNPLREEYDGRGYQLRGMATYLTRGSLQLSSGVGFARADGDPKVVYETPSIFDEPLDSRLDILSIELQIGQHLVTGGGRTSFTWGIGPTVFRVKESADIAFTEFEDGIEVARGVRTDTITKWKLGFDARISVQHASGGRFPIGVVTGFSFVPWDSSEEESLALDWLGKDYFFTYQLGITFGYLIF